MMRFFIAAAGVLGSWQPCHGILPTSDIRVKVSSASVTGLACRRRNFEMEYAKDVGRRYRHIARMTFTRNPDPRVVAMGLLAMVMMAPVAVLAVPADLAAATFRQECDFNFQARGTLLGWAGATAGQAQLAARGMILVSPGIEDVSQPVYTLSRASATADAQGHFSISVPGRVGRSRDFELQWLVNALPSGTMSLRKRGGTFILSEPEQEFGSAIEDTPPIAIQPQR